MNNIKYYDSEDNSLLEIAGKDAKNFLQATITADVLAIAANQLYPSALLNAQGKIMFDFLLFHHNNSFYIDIDKKYKDSFIQRLSMYKLRSEVNIIEHTAEHIITNIMPNAGFLDKRFTLLPIKRIYKTLTPTYDEFNKTYAEKIGFDKLRIDHAIAKLGVDFMPSSLYPHNINYDLLQAVSFTKGCYIGQEVVARMQHKTHIKKRLSIVVGQEALDVNADVVADEKIIGNLTSVYANKALAILRLDEARQASNISVNNKVVSIQLPPYADFNLAFF